MKLKKIMVVVVFLLIMNLVNGLNIEVEEVGENINSNRIDIKGVVSDITDPITKITVNVNGEDKLILVENIDNGEFEFEDVGLSEGNNVVVVKVEAGTLFLETLNINVDLERPEFTLEDIPAIVKDKALVINGEMNEPGNVRITVNFDDTQPKSVPKVEGLNQGEVESNKIPIFWNVVDVEEFDEFKHYIVYRDGVAIAILSDFSRPEFEDIKVLSDKEYTYRISVMSRYGVEGVKSNSFKIRTLEGGEDVDGIENYDTIDIMLGTEEFNTVVEDTQFPITVQLNKGDGVYGLKVEVFDRSGNRARVLSSETRLDTQPINIEVISPRVGARIFENRANNVNIRGITKPGATVHLMVFRNVDRTDPAAAYSIDVTGFLPDEIQMFGSAGFDIDCRGESCNLGEGVNVVADEEGNFVFKNIDLTPDFSFGGSSRERDLTEITNFVDTQDRSADILLFAVDDFDEFVEKEVHINIVNCWSGDQAWSVSTEFQDPQILSTERIAENTENLYILFNFDHISSGTDRLAELNHVFVRPACDSIGDGEEDRFSRGCQLLEGSFTNPVPLPGNKAYAIMKLNRINGMESWESEDWEEWYESFLPGGNNEVTFPLKISMNYNEDKDGQDGYRNPAPNPNTPLVNLNQETCHEVSYIIDTDKIDPSEVLPDWVLTDFSDSLAETSEFLGEIDEEVLDPAIEVAQIGCVGSFLFKFLATIYRGAVTAIDEVKIKSGPILDLVGGAGLVDGLGDSAWGGFNDNLECRELIVNLNLQGKGLKDVRDEDLKKCFPRSAGAWESEGKAYTGFRFSCDRLFGHTAPSKWTESVTDDKIEAKLIENNECKVDRTTAGEHLTPVKCKAVAKDFYVTPPPFDDDDECIRVVYPSSEGGLRRVNSLFQIGNVEEGNVYNIKSLKNNEGRHELDYAVKLQNNRYVVPQRNNCAKACESSVKKNADVVGSCQSVTSCNQQKANSLKGTYNFGGEQKNYNVFREGYTSDCFYEEGNLGLVNPSNPDSRQECCCIVEDDSKVAPSYFDVDDVDFKEEPIHEFEEELGDSKGVEDIKFSYRYHKQGFDIKTGEEVIDGDIVTTNKVKNYNPYRYIEGRDLPACFGQNYLFSKSGSELAQSKVEIDPYSNHLSTFQCLYLGGIRRNVNVVRNMVNKMNSCLVDIKTNGGADAGNCKEIFSHRMCGLFWDAYTMLNDDCSTNDGSGGVNRDSEDITNMGALRAGLNEAGLQSTQEFRNEYPTVISQGSNVFGIGGSSVSRQICLGAMNYDWGVIMENVGEMSYTTPTGAIAQALFPRRRYVTLDPVTGTSKYEYKTGVYIDSGCPISRYEVALACVDSDEESQYHDQIDCDNVGDIEGGSGCDCIDQGIQGKRQLLKTGRALSSNEVEDIGVSKVINSLFRYDHLRIKLFPDPRIDPETRDKCFKDGYEGGVYYFPIKERSGFDIQNCHFDYDQGFVCESEFTFNNYGPARFEDVQVTVGGSIVGFNQRLIDKVNVEEGKSVVVTPTIINQKREKCLRVSVADVDSSTTVNSEFHYVPVGTMDFLDIQISPQELAVFEDRDPISGDNLIKINPETNNNQRAVFVNIRFKDGNDDDLDDDDLILIDGDSEDMIKVDDGQYISIKSITNDRRNEVSRIDGRIYIKKLGTEISVVGASLPRRFDGSGVGEIEDEVFEVIRIAPSEGSTSQQKVIQMELFNLKQEVESFTSVADCDSTSAAKIEPRLNANDAEHNIIVNLRPRSSEVESGAVADPVAEDSGTD